MNLYKCQLEKDHYFVTATSVDEAEKILESALNKAEYGFSAHRKVISIYTLRLNVTFALDIKEKCKLFVVEGEVKVVDIPTDKYVIGRQFVIANTFDDAYVASGFTKSTYTTIIGENETFIGRYKQHETYIGKRGFIFKPVKN